MKRNLFFGTVLSAALAAGVAAQTTGTAPGQSSSRTQDQQNQIIVTGCLQNADMAGAGAAAGTSGSATSSAGATGQTTGYDKAQFMLTNATMAKTSAPGAAGAATSGTGTSGSTAGSATSGTSGAAGANRFLLVGGNQQNLKQYLNSQVEVQGRLEPSKAGTGATGSTASGTGTAATGTGSAAGQSASRMADVQRITVTSVRQIASTCTSR